MNTLGQVKFGWKWLAGQLNTLIDAINARTVAVTIGGGLDIQESKNGVLLTLSTGKLGSVLLTQLQVDTLKALISPPSSPVSGTFYPFSSSGVAQSEGWLGVAVMSPTCVKTTIAVWASNPGGGTGGGGL